MTEKKRLDILLFERGLTQSREKAQAMIMSGRVYVQNQKENKPGALFKIDSDIELRAPKLTYVSRGAT